MAAKTNSSSNQKCIFNDFKFVGKKKPQQQSNAQSIRSGSGGSTPTAEPTEEVNDNEFDSYAEQM